MIWAYLEKKDIMRLENYLLRLKLEENVIGLTTFLSWYGMTCVGK